MGVEIISNGDMPNKLNTGWPTYTDPLGQGDDHLRNIKKTLANMFTGLIGVPLPKLTPGSVGNGFRLFDGSVIDEAVDPILYAMYGENMLDLTGLALQGIKDLEVVGTVVGDQNKNHTHETTLEDADLGTKDSSTFDYGTKNTSTDSGHPHENPTTKSGTQQGSEGSFTILLNGGEETRGSHLHNVVIGSHEHTVVIGSHGHNFSIAAEGGDEVRINSMLCQWMCLRG